MLTYSSVSQIIEFGFGTRVRSLPDALLIATPKKSLPGAGGGFLTSLKSPEGLKDSECKKGVVTHHLPIPYVPPSTDLLAAKENSETMKVKFPDGTVLTMSIYSSGNPEEYLAHVIAVL